MDTALALLERGPGRRDLPRGHPDPHRVARAAEARRRAAGAPERQAGGPDRRDELGARAQRLADQAGQGPHPLRARRSPSRAWRSPRRSSPARSPSASGRASSSSGSGSAACRRCARPPSSARDRWARPPPWCWPAPGVEVQLGCRTAAQAEALRAGRENTRYLPGLELAQAHRRQDRARDRVRRRGPRGARRALREPAGRGG